MRRIMRFPTMRYMHPTKPAQISMRTCCSGKRFCYSIECFMTVQVHAEQHLKFLSFKGGCIGSYESTLVKMS